MFALTKMASHCAIFALIATAANIESQDFVNLAYGGTIDFLVKQILFKGYVFPTEAL